MCICLKISYLDDGYYRLNVMAVQLLVQWRGTRDEWLEKTQVLARISHQGETRGGERLKHWLPASARHDGVWQFIHATGCVIFARPYCAPC